jgi:UDP-N-acetylglucosamine 2-epimerase (non-hydrolysing)
MRILVASDQWFPEVRGGAARVATDGARMLAERGHEVVAIAPRTGGAPRFAVEDGVGVHRVLSRSALPQTLTDPIETRLYARRLGEKPFDVLLAHQSTTAVGLLPRARTAPLVLAYHASAPRELRFLRSQLGPGPRRAAAGLVTRPLELLERRAVSTAERILVLSEFSRSLLVADHDVDPGRIRGVATGVDTERFSPGDRAAARQRLGISGGGRLLFTARRLEPRMGLDRLLRALPAISTDYSLAVAGTGNAAELEALAHELGLGGRVRFLGAVGDQELVDWYRAADLFVLPTVAYEGFGMVTAEALACGTPVVGTPIGATPELLEPLEPHLLAASSEPDDLAAAIERAAGLANDDFRDRCRDYALDRFSWSSAAVEWEAALQEAASSRARWEAPTVARAGVRMHRRPTRTDLLVVAGARPNFMKAASIVHAAEQAGLSYALVHTGQHYDRELSEVFFDELRLPEPDVYLGVGSASHAEQTARIMLAFEAELLRLDPAVVVVVGDVNSTLACALVAVKEHYPVAHVEAGLRCGEPRMAEEINRKLCDHVAKYLFTTSRDADENLVGEGVPAEHIELVGNTMIDTLLRFAEAARARGVSERLGLETGRYGVATMHRPENVDSAEVLAELVDALTRVAAHVPLVIPLHPRTADRLRRFGLDEALAATPGIITTPPLGYLDFIGLLADAHVVLTDSGGIQEEATVLGVPCLTLRDSTERPVTVEMGTNRVVGRDSDAVVSATIAVLERRGRPASIPELWDGRAGERIVASLSASLYEREEAASAHA